MVRALEPLSVPAPIHAAEPASGPAALAMAAAALDDADAQRLADRLDGTRAAELAAWALRLGYHARLATPGEPGEVDERAREAGLQVRPPADLADVEAALAARHPAIASAPGDGAPFRLLLREAEAGVVLADPTADGGPATWPRERLAALLDARPRPRVLELAPRNRSDR